MKVLIVDDEPLARMLLQEYLQTYPQFQEVRQAGDGFEALKQLAAFGPDLVLLDIQMPRLTGFEVLELAENPPPVIFTTAFDQYAIRAFEAAAIDYLLKPIGQDRFDKAIQRFLAGQQPRLDASLLPAPSEVSTRIAVRDRGAVVFVPTDSLLYCEAQDDLVKLVTTTAVYYKTITMAKLEASLPPAKFVRVHRSFILQLGYMDRLEPYGKGSYQAIMTNGDRVAVSEAGYAKLRG